jgi:hypothetical protein
MTHGVLNFALHNYPKRFNYAIEQYDYANIFKQLFNRGSDRKA